MLCYTSSILSLSLALLALTAAAQGGCNHNLMQFYSQLNCKPLSTDDQKCPTKYDCSEALARKADKCYYMGKEYALNSSVPKENFRNLCTVDCRCQKQFDGSTSFICVTSECPELFHSRLEPGCYRQYSHDKCCAIKTYCPPKEAESDPEPTCEYGGNVYRDGAAFYPKDHPCKKCICSAGFNGTVSEPWCKEISCDLDLHYGSDIAAGCIPVYYGEDGCCPIEWRCPKPEDQVVPQPTKSSPSARQNEAKCKFGKLELYPGDTISPAGDNNTECQCVIPPYPICVKKPTE